MNTNAHVTNGILNSFGTQFKAEEDKLLAKKANAEEVAAELAAKAAANEVYKKSETYNQTEIDTAISTAVANSSHLKKLIVTAEEITAFEADPTTADANTLYLLKDEEAAGEDIYKEYTVVGDEFVCTGSTSISLDGYVKEEDINYATEEDISEMISGIFGSTETTE